MLSEKDLQDIEQVAFLLISVVERLRVHNEDASERRKAFRFVTNETDEKEKNRQSKPLKFTKKELETI